MHSHHARQQPTCPSGYAYYKCASGAFTGCCGFDPCETGICDDQCDENSSMTSGFPIPIIDSITVTSTITITVHGSNTPFETETTGYTAVANPEFTFDSAIPGLLAPLSFQTTHSSQPSTFKSTATLVSASHNSSATHHTTSSSAHHATALAASSNSTSTAPPARVVVGGTIGGLSFLCLVLLLFCGCFRRKNKEKKEKETEEEARKAEEAAEADRQKFLKAAIDRRSLSSSPAIGAHSDPAAGASNNPTPGASPGLPANFDVAGPSFPFPRNSTATPPPQWI